MVVLRRAGGASAVAALIALVAGATFAQGGASAARGWDLSGKWTSPLPKEHSGTSLTLTQSDSTITWRGDRMITHGSKTSAAASVATTSPAPFGKTRPESARSATTAPWRSTSATSATSSSPRSCRPDADSDGRRVHEGGCTTAATVAYKWSAHFSARTATSSRSSRVQAASRRPRAQSAAEASVDSRSPSAIRSDRPDNAVWTIELNGPGRYRASTASDSERLRAKFRASV